MPASEARGQDRAVAVVLAAGLSTRFGAENKLLADHGGAPLVSHAVRCCLTAMDGQVWVVVGHQAEELRAALSLDRVRFVDNPDYPAGMASSVVCAARVAESCGAHLVLHLGDMPDVRPATLRGLLEAHADRDAWAVVPEFHGHRGHPVVFGRAWLPALQTLRGDLGARGLLEARARHVQRVACDDPGVLKDVDRPD